MMVSVLMITYKHEKFLAQAMEGVLMQKTNFPFELIISNDNSPDQSQKIIDQYAAKYPVIKSFHHQSNLGAQKNYVFAYQQCSGKYIAVCEGDDYWTDKYKLQKQVDFLEAHPECVAAFHDAMLVDERGHLIAESKLGNRKHDYTATQMKKGVVMPTASVVYRKMTPSLPAVAGQILNGDTFLWAYLGQYGHAKYMDNISPCAYRQHSGGVWSSETFYKKRLNTIKTWQALKEYFQKDEEIHQHYKRKILRKKIQLILYASKRMKFHYLKEILLA